MGAMLRRFCAVSFCHRLPEPGKLTSRPHIQVNAKNANHTILILNAILNSECLTALQTRLMVSQLLKEFA